MMRKSTSRWASVALVLFLAACGGDDDTEPLQISGNNTSANATTPNNTTTSANVDPGNNVDVVENPAVEMVLETSAETGPSGFSTEIVFDVPENTQSLTITVVGTPGTTYTLSYWRNGPDGEFVVPQNWYSQSQVGPTLCVTCPNRIVSSDAAFAGMLPVNPAELEVVPGEHAIGLFSYNIEGFNLAPTASNVEVKVIAKVLPERPSVGVVDMNLFFTGAGGWTAETAPEDPAFQEILDQAEEVWGQVGMGLGEFTYNDIDPAYAVIEEATVPGGDLTEMFALSADAPRDAVNVFFVDEIMAGGPLGGFGVILGISGGIPGPAGVMGSGRSGVAVIVEPPAQAPTPIGLVFAHEVGHYLGLSHTSENAFAGQTHDQLTDTPENDASYLMHNMGSGNKMSEQQGIVMRLNPWTRNEGANQ
jgi:hypothetical protein